VTFETDDNYLIQFEMKNTICTALVWSDRSKCHQLPQTLLCLSFTVQTYLSTLSFRNQTVTE